jgi:hypothetical protein
MRRIAAALGVDYDQWKALTLVALKLDFRGGSFGRSRFGAGARSTAVLVSQAIFYSVYGLFMAIVIWATRDLFLAGTVLTTYVTFMVGTTVLLDHNSALTSPKDYAILGFRPVSSRTYFASRLANALVYTTGITTLTAYLPAVSLFIRHGALVGVAGIAALYGCSFFTAFSILFGYGWLMNIVGADALKRALSYVQLAMSFLIYGGYFLMSQLSRSLALTSVSLPKAWWMLFVPPMWFAAYLDAATGRLVPIEFVAILLSVGLLVGLVAGLGGRLSLSYSDRLAAIAASSKPARPAKAGRSRGGWWFRAGEARAVAVLVRSQFRNDQRFRMGILSILPLTLIYVVMGVRDGNLHDPFVASAGRGLSFVTVAVLMFPSMLKPALTRSDAFRASWIFFACPADRLRIIRSAKNVLVAFFLLPYLLFIGAIFLYLSHNVWHVVVHVALLGLISHLVLQANVLLDPELPFSRPMQVNRRANSIIMLMVVMFVISALLQGFSATLYQSPTATAIAFGVVITASIVMELLTRARVELQARSLEFEG